MARRCGMNHRQRAYLGRLLRAERIAHGLSIAEASEHIGFDPQAYGLGQIERGEVGTGLDHFASMVDVYALDANTIIAKLNKLRG